MSRNSGTPYERILESITTLAYLSSITTRVRIGISSLITAMRNPVTVAKQLSTIDNLSGGRLMLATSSGWNEREFSNLGADFHTRGKRLDESIRVIRALWGGSTSFESKILGLKFENTAFEPSPVQTKLTIWIGGTSRAAMKRAASLGDAWHPNVLLLPQFRELVSQFRKSFPAARNRDICVRIALDSGAKRSEYVSPQGEKRMILSGNTAENRTIISELEKLGVSQMVVAPNYSGNISVPKQVEGLKALAQQFIS
jgi:alkanesulfonate monooxygenase SsuD/methylene tetrahydromethanopterin reductase-like flavin-dependent oxidoreductase (luciferase family)